jgi:phosphohistidine phosphatase
MDLYLIRHAVAAERGSWSGPDAERPLTPEGERRFAREVRGLARLEVQFQRVLTSPWKRARDSAQMLAELAARPPEECPELAAPPGDALLALLGEESTALVGHEPWLSDLAALLLSKTLDGGAFEVKKGAVVHLEGEPRRAGMQLRALLPPRVLRALAGG